MLAMKYFDLFYVDIKLMDDLQCKNLLGGAIALYVDNFDYLWSSGKKIIVRMPIIAGYTDGKDNLESVCSFLVSRGVKHMELLKEHHLGNAKYESLGKKCPVLYGVSDEQMSSCQQFFKHKGIDAKVCKI
jgi:pyruvate formate lyase activating enzyme